MELEACDPNRGPLDVYRQKASFNWKEMRLFIDGRETVDFKVPCVFTVYCVFVSEECAELF